MSQLVVAVGVLAVLLGLAATVRPRQLLRLARRLTVGTWLRVVVFAVRVALGTVLILVAPSTLLPLPLQVVGVLLIVAGIVVLVIGNDGVQRLLNRALSLGPVAVVVGGILGVLFGALLIYAGV